MTPQPSKQLRWVGQPSEEELLGIPVSLLPRRSQVPVRAAQPPPARRVDAPPSLVPRRQPREPLAVLALAGVAAVMLGGIGAGSRFSGASPVALGASAEVPGQVVVDRQELGSLPRAVPSSSQDDGDRTSQSGTVEDRGPKPESKNEPSPPGGGGGGGGGSDNPSDPPLVQATLPVVGTVTVNEPELPTDVVPETPTVPLP
jgi:hypothetical protein